MKLLKKILVLLDGSRESESALHQLARLKVGRRSHVRLLHVCTPSHADRAHADHYLALTVAKFEPRLRIRDSAVVGGDAATAAVHHAITNGFTLLALSSSAPRLFMRLAHRSVADELIRRSIVPLLIVRHGATASQGRCILLPLDGSRRSEQMIEPAVELAKATRGRIVLCGTAVDSKRAVALYEHLAAVLARLARAHVPATTAVVRIGDPVTEILTVARAEGADVVALATHGRSGEDRRRLGSVTERLLRRCRLPLLVKRAGGLLQRGRFARGRRSRVRVTGVLPTRAPVRYV